MANQLLTISDITNEGLDILENELVFTKHVRRDFDDRFGEEGAKIGDTINIRKPARFQGHRGQAIQIEDFVETSVPLVLSQQYQQAFAFTSKDLKLSLDMFNERVLRPAMVPVANMIDSDGTALFLQAYQEVGVPGTVPNTLLTYLQAAQKLNESSVPDMDWTLIISPAMQATIVDALKGLFNPQIKISGQYEKGEMGRATAGFDWFMSQNAPTFTTGAQGGTPTTSSTANQTGTSITTSGWTANATGVLLAGDIITFAGCFAVNYVGKQALANLAQWRVTSTVNADGSGNATVNISGPDGAGIILTGATQNASASPTASGAITIQGAGAVTSSRGLAFHKSFAAFGCADLPMPNGVDMGARKNDDQLGLSMRIVRAYDINTDRFPARCDLLGGWAVLYPQFGVRVAS